MNASDKTRLDPFGTTLVEDYGRLYEDFGIQPFQPLLPHMPNPMAVMRRGVIFGHRDFERILRAMKEEEDRIIMQCLSLLGQNS